MPTDIGNIYLSAHLNASQCALNEKDWPGACAYATRAIKCVPDSVKGLYRRGCVPMHMGLLRAESLASTSTPSTRRRWRGHVVDDPA